MGAYDVITMSHKIVRNQFQLRNPIQLRNQYKTPKMSHDGSPGDIMSYHESR